MCIYCTPAHERYLPAMCCVGWRFRALLLRPVNSQLSWSYDARLRAGGLVAVAVAQTGPTAKLARQSQTLHPNCACKAHELGLGRLRSGMGNTTRPPGGFRLPPSNHRCRGACGVSPNVLMPGGCPYWGGGLIIWVPPFGSIMSIMSGQGQPRNGGCARMHLRASAAHPRR